MFIQLTTFNVTYTGEVIKKPVVVQTDHITMIEVHVTHGAFNIPWCNIHLSSGTTIPVLDPVETITRAQ